MIENMRKYTGLMAIVFVLLGAGFIFTMNNGASSSGGAGSGPTILEVGGQSLDQQTYHRMGSRTIELSRELGLYQYSVYLNSQDVNRFIANRIIIQKAFDDMGIFAGEDEITEAIKASPAFSSRPTAPNQPGKFDEKKYSTFLEKNLGKRGMTEKDLRALFGETLCLNKLIEIIGGGLLPVRSATQDQLEAQSQTVTLAKIILKRDDFVEKENPSEEEIKTYWESHQDAYKTDEKRRISYVMLDLPKEEADKKDEEKTPAVSTAKTEAEKTAEKAKKEAEAKAKSDKAEIRRLAAKDLTREINDIYEHIGDSEAAKKPLNFETLITESKRKTVKTALFTRSTLPKELAGLNLRGSFNRNRPLGEDIFNVAASSNNYDKISLPLPVGEHGWIIFYVDEIVEPILLDYAAAHDKARAKLISENGTKKCKQAAKDQRTAILALMKDGKGFDAAAKEKGLTPIQVGPFSPMTPPKDEPSARQFHSIASGLNPGDVSETIDENDRSVFFFVEKRELEDTEANKLRLDFTLQRAQDELKFRTYQSWLNQQYTKADVKGAATEQN